MNITPITFTSNNPGSSLLITGAVHGDEICGPLAITQIIERFNASALNVEKGSVTFIPICNPRAHEAGKRFIDTNLNRGFRRHDAPTHYEHHLMNEITPYLESCDVILDIHSYDAGGPAFAFRGMDELREREEPIIAATGIDHVIYGWDEAYAESGVIKDQGESLTTSRYARKFGAVGSAIECGQHREPSAVPVAIRAIEGVLGYCGIVPHLARHDHVTLRNTRIKNVYFKNRAGAFAKAWQHLDTITQGDIIAQYEDGETITAHLSGRIVLPNTRAAIGHEWFYLGVEE